MGTGGGLLLHLARFIERSFVQPCSMSLSVRELDYLCQRMMTNAARTTQEQGIKPPRSRSECSTHGACLSNSLTLHAQTASTAVTSDGS